MPKIYIPKISDSLIHGTHFLYLGSSKVPNHERVKCLACQNVVDIPTTFIRNGRWKTCGCGEKAPNIPEKARQRFINQKFGRLIVLDLAYHEVNNAAGKYALFAKVKCSCGTEKWVGTTSLIRKRAPLQSCGCYKDDKMRERWEAKAFPPGTVFGRKTVLESKVETLPSGEQKRHYLCECTCGVKKWYRIPWLNKSCACARRESSRVNLLKIIHKRREKAGVPLTMAASDLYVTLRASISDLLAAIKKADGYKCQLCGYAKGRILESHHIIPIWQNPELFDEQTNIVTLCRKCHKLAHKHKWDQLDSELVQFLEYAPYVRDPIEYSRSEFSQRVITAIQKNTPLAVTQVS